MGAPLIFHPSFLVRPLLQFLGLLQLPVFPPGTTFKKHFENSIQFPRVPNDLIPAIPQDLRATLYCDTH